MTGSIPVPWISQVNIKEGKMTYLDRIAASQAKANMVINNQLAYARALMKDPYLPYESKMLLLEVEGLSWTVKVLLEEALPG